MGSDERLQGKTIRWLHISDLHFNSDDMSTSELREQLPLYLRKQNIRCDYVFCTGDIRTAYEKNNDFTDEAVAYLKNICDAVGTSTEHLYIVAGNHDVERNALGRDEAIKRINFKRTGYYDAARGLIEGDDLRVIHSGQALFRGFLSKVYDDVPDRLELYNNPLAPHFNIETGDFNILHIDSTLTYTEEQEAYDLVLGGKLVQNALRTMNRDKPTILLSHYPFSSLRQEEKKHISEMLYRRGVKLWLAGHEHAHMLQSMQYFDSIQAGELKIGDQTQASVLIGEMDDSIFQGRIYCLTWFSEGWARYPIISHNEKEGEYPFHLGLPRNEGKSREAIKCNQANAEFICHLPDTVFPELFPRIVVDADETRDDEKDDIGIEDSDITPKTELAEETNSLDWLSYHMWLTHRKHIILLADGGMGKTTMLLEFCKKTALPVLYIPVERLNAIGVSIKEYCAYKLFDGNHSALAQFAAKRYTSSSLILLIDGLNEVDGSSEQRIINEIKALELFEGIQFIITSRYDFTARYSMPGYHKCILEGLSRAQIKSVFSDLEWVGIKDSTTFQKLLSNPMMVTMYKEISPIMKQYASEETFDWILPIKNTTDLLRNYYVSQIAVMFDRNGMGAKDIMAAYQIVLELLPALGYAFESAHTNNMENSKFRTIVDRILKEKDKICSIDDLAPLQEKLRTYSEPVLERGIVIDLLTKSTHLLYSDKAFTSFPHQIYRDYLSAVYIEKMTKGKAEKKRKSDEAYWNETIDLLWNQRAIPVPVQEHIRNMSEQCWNEGGIADTVHWAGAGRGDTHNLVQNLIDCFPYTEYSGCPDYSCLDLRGIQIPDVKMEYACEKVSLRGCFIDEASVGKEYVQPTAFTYLKFSPDNAFLATYGEKRISIYYLLNDNKPFVYTTGADIDSLAFCEDYLFAITKGMEKRIIVFLHSQDDWKYVGTMGDPSETHHSLLNSRLHSIILTSDVKREHKVSQNGGESENTDILHFYYNNREIIFSLNNCKRIGNYARKHAWESQVAGRDLTFLARCDGAGSSGSRRTKRKQAKEIGINCSTGNNGLRAEASTDGGLTVYSGAEVYHILERGTTRLKDGAISGNGNTAVTLSYDLFNENRRAQIWDLNEKRRIAEIRCPREVDNIHMSDSGRWIIGIAENRTWTYDRENGTEEWYDEHFVSSQHSKVSFYDEKVIRKQENKLFLYDLGTKKAECVGDLGDVGNIACIMEDGSVATTDKRGKMAKFRNTGTGECSEVNDQNANVIGIQDLRGKPFIAVATRDNMISIYHTRTCQRTRKLQTTAGNNMMVVHPDELVIANSDGYRAFETNNYYEKGERGWWFCNPYRTKEHPIYGDVLDLAFNTAIHELVVILSNGEIMYCHEKYCSYHSSTDIIISFNTDAYDFKGCRCSKKLMEMLYRNGAEGEVKLP